MKKKLNPNFVDDLSRLLRNEKYHECFHRMREQHDKTFFSFSVKEY